MAAQIEMKTKRPGDATHYARKGATCRIHYEGKLSDGTIFDSSRARQKALMFKLGEGQLIEGLEQAVAKMSTGQICLFTVPPSLGYGVNGYLPVVPPNATLYARLAAPTRLFADAPDAAEVADAPDAAEVAAAAEADAEQTRSRELEEAVIAYGVLEAAKRARAVSEREYVASLEDLVAKTPEAEIAARLKDVAESKAEVAEVDASLADALAAAAADLEAARDALARDAGVVAAALDALPGRGVARRARRSCPSSWASSSGLHEARAAAAADDDDGGDGDSGSDYDGGGEVEANSADDDSDDGSEEEEAPKPKARKRSSSR
ncbi:peptidyl-prolyl cis-trans isomerase [Aureococcus anophagefferens]|nr:peptidyl-prolyl cis-trans isomerase [Aureococcus anophagefferens]